MPPNAPSRAQGLHRLQSPAHARTFVVSRLMMNSEERTEGKGNAKGFDEVQDKGDDIREHDHPARSDARLRVPVEVPDPQFVPFVEEI